MNYLLSASILLLAIWPMYHLLLQYSDRYVLNRFLLLLAIVVVITLPFVSFTSPVPEVSETLQGTITYLEEGVLTGGASVDPEPKAVYHDEAGEEILIASPITITFNLLPKIYYLGLGFLTLVLGFRLLFLLSLHLRSRLSSDGRYRMLHQGASSGQAFTFGTTLYFSADVVNGPDFDHVLAHESIHARQGHSLDIFLSELFLCVLWFHPAAWWLRAKMRANLEYLVDKAVIAGGADRRDYQLALVRQSQATYGLALTLPFSEPSLKSRVARMTGMSEYRVISIVATVALLFWLGVAAMVVKGEAAVETAYNTFQFDDGVLHQVDRPLSATEFLYATYFAQPLPEKINSFELYFRRLPTPDEYLQIKSILQRIPHTNFSIYEPCNGTPGAYIMQLSHYLKQEAVFRNPLREGDFLPYHFAFTLRQRTTTQPIPDDLPIDSYGYYDPAILSTAFRVKETGAGFEYFDGVKSYPVTNGTPKVGEEELAVFINGERFDLLPKPEVKFADGMQFAGYAESSTWLSVEGKATDLNALPNSLGQMPDRTVVPPNARMACLLGLEDNTTGMVRKVFTNGAGTPEGYFEAHLLGVLKGVMPQGTKTPYRMENTLLYLNNKSISKEALLKIDFPQGTIVQTGWNTNVSNGPVIVQVITDMKQR